MSEAGNAECRLRPVDVAVGRIGVRGVEKRWSSGARAAKTATTSEKEAEAHQVATAHAADDLAEDRATRTQTRRRRPSPKNDPAACDPDTIGHVPGLRPAPTPEDEVVGTAEDEAATRAADIVHRLKTSGCLPSSA